MLSSRLPTGTISRDRTTTRTYPRDVRDRPPSEGAGSHQSEPSETWGNRLDALRDENEALREQNARLRSQLDTTREHHQDIIDRYEYVVAGVENDSEPARTRRQQVPRGWIASLLSRLGRLVSR